MFDLTEINERIDKHEKLLKGIQHKMKEMRNSFDEIYSELENCFKCQRQNLR